MDIKIDMNIKMFFIVFLLTLFTFFSGGFSGKYANAKAIAKVVSKAAAKPSGKPKSKPKSSKIHITSNSLIVNNKKKTAVFSGKVIAVKKGLKVFSDNLEVIYTKKSKIKNLIATGHVHIIKGKNNITGGKAVFYNLKRIVIVTGEPVAWAGKNRITGDKIEMNLKTGVSTVLSGHKRRVSAVIYSSKSLTLSKNGKKKTPKNHIKIKKIKKK